MYFDCGLDRGCKLWLDSETEFSGNTINVITADGKTPTVTAANSPIYCTEVLPAGVPKALEGKIEKHFLPSYYGSDIVLIANLTAYNHYISVVLPNRDKTKAFQPFTIPPKDYIEVANNNRLISMFHLEAFNTEEDSLFGKGMRLAIVNYKNNVQVFDNNSNVVISVEALGTSTTAQALPSPNGAAP